jgi:signal transduction histidine kinase
MNSAINNDSSEDEGETNAQEIVFPKRSEVGGFNTPCHLEIEVQDTGIGMTAEEQGRLFNRFSQANNFTTQEYGGSGLGLFVSAI